MVSTTQIIGESPAEAANVDQAPATAERAGPAPVAPPEAPRQLDPTRYGDWEKNGRCIDF